jgi:methionyl aminopeptidase
MDDDTYKKYILAGKIASEARDYGEDLIKSGIKLLDVVNKVESRIIEKGGGLAFPVNISINEVAAHYSPNHEDTLVFKKGDVVKLDVGAHIDGYIADTATTVEVEANNYYDLIKASSDALENILNFIKPGIHLYEVGKIVEDTIQSFDFKPIENLTGHSMKRYVLHTGMSVPNVSNKFYRAKPKEGDVLAIEPFATNGAGHVNAGDGSNIYICNESVNLKLLRNQKSRIIYNKVKKKFKTLPFAQRWFERSFSNSDLMMRKLLFSGLIKQYPQLIDAKKGIVSQKEHTVILIEDGCEVIT